MNILIYARKNLFDLNLVQTINNKLLFVVLLAKQWYGNLVFLLHIK